jgi:hypothetical protein
MTTHAVRRSTTPCLLAVALVCAGPAVADEASVQANRQRLQQLDQWLEVQVKQAEAKEATFTSRNASQAKAVAFAFQTAPQVVPTVEQYLPNTNAEIMRVFRVTLTEAGAGFSGPFNEAGRVVDRSFGALSFREAQRGAGALALHGFEQLTEITAKVDGATAAGQARAIVQDATLHDLNRLTASTLHRLGVLEQAKSPAPGQLIMKAVVEGSPVGNTQEAVKAMSADARPRTAQELKLLDLGLRLSAAVGKQAEVQMLTARERGLEGRIKTFESQVLDAYTQTHRRELERMAKGGEPTEHMREVAGKRAFGSAVYEHAKQLLRLRQGGAVTGELGLKLRESLIKDRLRELQTKSLPELVKLARDLGKPVSLQGVSGAGFDVEAKRVEVLSRVTGISEAEVRQRIKASTAASGGMTAIVDPTRKRRSKQGKGRVRAR